VPFSMEVQHLQVVCRGLEPPGPWLASLPVMPGNTGNEVVAKHFFVFTHFHGPSVARPQGWRLLTRNGKVSRLLLG
jgi:hypothetical protein